VTNDKLLKEKGHYSRNYRLDVSDCEEDISDDKEERKKWLEGDRKVRLKRKIKRWKNNISTTTTPENLTVHMVGQSHIDVAWMWRCEQTHKKAQVTFSKAILHSEVYPETFRFALSQPLLLEWIKEDNLDLFKKIQKKVKEGNIELVGGSYVEPDCMMPSAEAMIRQRLYGMRFFKENFDTLPQIEWFLDSFGYNHGLPQILAKSGVKYFWTTKLTWNRDTTFPFVHFWWKSPDGTQLLTCNFHYDFQVLETWEEYEIGRHLLLENGRKDWDYTMDYSQLRNHVRKEDICPHVGLFFGQSDGGHGPTHQEVAEANKLSTFNWFEWSGIEKFFNEIKQYSRHFPIWNDELYLEFHRGCFSNHARVKRYNRKFENLIVSLESLMVLLSILIGKDKYKPQKEKLEKLWKITLKNQFHDILPGSSIPEVYDDCWGDWTTQKKLIQDIKDNIGASISHNEEEQEAKNSSASLLLYNSLSWNRQSRVFIPISVFHNKVKRDEEGKPLYAKLILIGAEKEYICQPISAEPENAIDPRPAGWWTVLNLKPFSIAQAKLILVEIEEEKSWKLRKKNTLSNNIISIKFDENNGSIISLTSKNINNGKNLVQGKESNLISCFRDRVPLQYHAWNLTPEYWNHPIKHPNDKDVQLSIKNQGPIFSTLEIKKTIGTSPVIQKITLFKKCNEIYFDYYSDWQEKDAMVKITYSPSFNAEKVTADGMACTITSKIHPESHCDKARFEKICHKYFDLSTPEKTWGMALLNEGKYAYDVMEGNMRLTLLRACRYPEPAPEAWVNKERELNKRLYGHKPPEYSGIGPFSCRYALFPHRGSTLTHSDGTSNVDVTRKAEELNNPVFIVPLKKINGLEEEFLSGSSLFTISPKHVRISALKYNEWDNNGTIIIRFHEFCGISSEVEVVFYPIFASNISTISPVDLLERKSTKSSRFQKNNGKGILSFYIEKYELRSFQMVLS
jgi:alpha-mannosidase